MIVISISYKIIVLALSLKCKLKGNEILSFLNNLNVFGIFLGQLMLSSTEKLFAEFFSPKLQTVKRGKVLRVKFSARVKNVRCQTPRTVICPAGMVAANIPQVHAGREFPDEPPTKYCFSKIKFLVNEALKPDLRLLCC